MTQLAQQPSTGQSVAARYANRFRSSVTWKPADWQQPLDQLVSRLCRAAWLNPSLPANASSQEPIEFTVEEAAILFSGEQALTAAREANDMPKFRRIIEQYEERAMEFLGRARAGMLTEISNLQSQVSRANQNQ